MQFPIRQLVVMLLWCGVGCQSVPRGMPEPTVAPEKADIERLMDAYRNEGMFNGMAIVARDGRVIFEKAYGYADAEWDARPDGDTKFRLASITKQFTALMILQMAEEGKLTPEDTIDQHLPWYRKDTGSRITIHHLLTHTSGIPDYSEFSGFFSGPSRLNHEMRPFVETYCSRDLESEPGERYSYCNSGYYILGAILEEIDGKPWEQVVHERISLRGGMADTGAYSHTKLMPRRAQGYTFDSARSYQPVGYQDMTIWRAAGAMYSTANDMLKWDQALRRNVLLGKEWKARMFTRQQGIYGYGVNVIEAEDSKGRKVRYMGHSGSYAGFNNYFAHFPDTGEAIILLNNGGRTEINSIRDGIVNILLGNPYDMPVATHQLASAGADPRVTINRISSRGVIGADDAQFAPANAAAGTTIYSMNAVIHDGEHAYMANSTGRGAGIRDGRVATTPNSIRNEGMAYGKTDWLTSDLVVSLTGEETPRLELAWTFRNSSPDARSLRMVWFTDTDLTTAGSSSSEDRLALLPKPNKPSERALLAFNHPKDGAPESASGLLFQVEGAPHHFLGIAESAGASGYWRSTAPFEAIGLRAAGYQIPPQLRGTIQHDDNNDGRTDGPRDVGVSVQVDVELPPNEARTVRLIVEFGPAIEL